MTIFEAPDARSRRVAVATGMSWLATGTDLGGSLRTPASFCSVVGSRLIGGPSGANVSLSTWRIAISFPFAQGRLNKQPPDHGQ